MHFACVAINPTRLSQYWTNKKTGHADQQCNQPTWCRIHSVTNYAIYDPDE